MADQAWWLHKLLHSVLNDEQTVLRVVKYVCRGWLLQYDDIQTCISVFFADVYFAPIELMLTEEHIGLWPKVNSLLALNLHDLFDPTQLAHIRDVPKQAGSLFSLQVGVVADRPMWTKCTVNRELDESTGDRLQLLRAFVKTMVEEVTTSYEKEDSTCTHVLRQLRLSLMGGISAARHVHSCEMACRLRLLDATHAALSKQTHTTPEVFESMWDSITRDVAVARGVAAAAAAAAAAAGRAP